MKKIKNYCIYCGTKEATEKDHVPPKCFFPKPLPSNLITVPSCSDCNREFGKIDEFVRNVLVSLDATEKKIELATLREKMFRSLLREQGTNLLFKIYKLLKPVDVVTNAGIFIEQKHAFDMDTEEFYKFFERIARALLYIENHIEYFNGKFNWSELADYSHFPAKVKFCLENDIRKSNANGMFKYSGMWVKGHISSLWFVKLYNSVEFQILVQKV